MKNVLSRLSSLVKRKSTSVVLPPPNLPQGVKIVPLSETVLEYGCGHQGIGLFKVNLYGGDEIAPNENVLCKRLKCPNCMVIELLAKTIRCARCGLAIMPGEGVAKYSRAKYDPEYATVDGDCVIGCLRWECCPSGGYIVGNWNGEKIVPLYGGKTVTAHVLSRGRIIYVDRR